MTGQPSTLAPLAAATGVDDVIGNLDRIIDWSIRAHSTIGYFAVDRIASGRTAPRRRCVQRRIGHGASRFQSSIWCGHIQSTANSESVMRATISGPVRTSPTGPDSTALKTWSMCR